jgi:hypothetical protein
MAFIICGVAIGALCALLRYPVFVMAPLSALLAVATVLNGIITHAHPGVIAIEVFGSVTTSQFMYASVGLTHHLVHLRKLVLEAQAAIGRELRTELELPRSMPPELSALVTRLQFA